MLKLRLWGFILAIPSAMARKCSNCAYVGSFLATLGPGLENAQIARLGAHFGYFWGQGQQMLKLRRWGLILGISGPGLENAEIAPLGPHFGHFWGQGHQMLKIAALGVHFSVFCSQPHAGQLLPRTRNTA